jgi:hypothetical protein
LKAFGKDPLLMIAGKKHGKLRVREISFNMKKTIFSKRRYN